MLSCVPPEKAYALSQYWQRSGHPVSRTNTVGRPTVFASPCRERKISVILREGSDPGLSTPFTHWISARSFSASEAAALSG